MPDPLGGFGIPILGVYHMISGAGSDLIGGFLNALGGLISHAVATGAKDAFDEVESLVNNSAGNVSFAPSSWWATKVGAASAGKGLWPTVMALALAVMLICVLLAVIQSALAGDAMAGVRALAVELPKSVLGMVTVVAFTALLVGVVDAASAAVLPGTGANFGQWAGNLAVSGFVGVFPLILMLVGALLVWVELVVRDGLIFLMVAMAPIVLAVRVWPAAKGLWRRFVEIAVALIVAKFAIALALALGADALAASATKGSASATAMVTGGGLMLVSAFSPFVLLRLIPGLEGAMSAQGISRMPARTVMTAVSLTTSAAFLARLAAGSNLATVPTAAGGAPGGVASPPPATTTLAGPFAMPPGGGGRSPGGGEAIEAGTRPLPLPPPPKALPPGGKR